MAVLLILASPHVLSEPSGAGARPVHPIRYRHEPSKECPVLGQIALQKSKVAGSRIFRENTKREAIADSV